MKVAFFVSSIGDTDLAISTIKSMEKKGQYEAVLISLTQVAQQRVANFESKTLVAKKTLDEITDSNSDLLTKVCCTNEQLASVLEYLHIQKINHAYFGIPSVNNEIPFQIARSLDDIPVLMAYEFMFKPENNCLWKYLPDLNKKSNVQWALQLPDAIKDFDTASKIHVIGHLSIDNAYSIKSQDLKDVEEIRKTLQVSTKQSLTFISSTTQPVEIDSEFLDCLLTELPKHPKVQVRLGLHPGIQDLDAYLVEILSTYKKHSKECDQFKIILPDTLRGRLKKPELTIDNFLFRQVFLRVNINGSEGALAADRVAQAVPGALLNQAVLEGKPAYSQHGKPYLPRQYFSDSIATFFSGDRQKCPTKEDLGLNENTAPERCAAIFTGSM